MNREVLKQTANRLLLAHHVPGVGTGDISELLLEGQVVDLDDGDIICAEGSPPDSLYLLLWGQCRVLKADDRGKQRELTSMVSPAILGHMALLDGSKRSATCAAKGKARLLVIERVHAERLLAAPTRTGTALRRLLLASLTRQLTGANARVRELLHQSLDESDQATTLPPSAAITAADVGRAPRPQAPPEKDDLRSEFDAITGLLEGWVGADEQG